MRTSAIPRPLTLLLFLCFAATVPGSADAKSYSADRFDTHVTVLPDGAIEVTETVVFRFEDGTFTYVFREIPKRRTDGIRILRAAMDGRDMPFGDGPGEVEVREKSDVHVRWNFARKVSADEGGPEGGPAHTFTLTYRVAGVVRDSPEGDLFAWRALPADHDYEIARAAIEIEHSPELVGAPEIDSRRAEDIAVRERDGAVLITASDIRKNGWVTASLLFPPGSVIASPPEWQLRQRRADALAPRWLGAAGLICAAGLLLLWGMRQRYDAPAREDSIPSSLAGIPDDLPPAIAGALASNGRVSHEHAMAALFSLADRGAIRIDEEPRGTFGQRSFVLRRQPFHARLAPHEHTALDIAFTDKHGPQETMRLSKVRSRLASRLKEFRTALYADMRDAGLIDPDRKATHGRFGAVSLTIILAGAALFIPAAFLIPGYRGWPLLIPAALTVVGVAGFIFQASVTPLSNEGVRRAARWRAYQQHLKDVARRQTHLASDSPATVLSFAVGLGLASAWAKFVKTHPAATPPWFYAISASDRDGFPAFIAYAGANTGGGGAGAGAGAAAGGGASGAG